MDLSKLRYIAPNSFTLGSVLSSMISMYLASTAQTAGMLSLAAWLIFVSMVCDLLDGRVARLTRAESELGVQLDSLADAISFGVAPAWLMFHWGLKPLGVWGVVIAFIYVACTLLRLARFNVLAQQAESHGVSRYFSGLPSPLAAGGVVSVVLAHLSITDQMATPATYSVIILAVLLGVLMVSNIPYRTFKDVNFRGRAGVISVALLVLAIVAGVLFDPSYSIVGLMCMYIVMGLVGGAVSLGKMLFIHEDAESLGAHDDEELLRVGDDEGRG